MNFKSIFAKILQGAANGAVQALQAENGKTNWQSVGIVAAFGAIVGLSQAFSQHPAVVTAVTNGQVAQPAPAPSTVQ